MGIACDACGASSFDSKGVCEYCGTSPPTDADQNILSQAEILRAIEQGDYATALDAANRSVENYPEDSNAWTTKAECLFELLKSGIVHHEQVAVLVITAMTSLQNGLKYASYDQATYTTTIELLTEYVDDGLRSISLPEIAAVKEGIKVIDKLDRNDIVQLIMRAIWAYENKRIRPLSKEIEFLFEFNKNIRNPGLEAKKEKVRKIYNTTIDKLKELESQIGIDKIRIEYNAIKNQDEGWEDKEFVLDYLGK